MFDTFFNENYFKNLNSEMDLLKNTIDVDEDYYDVNSILAINSNVAVVFRKDTPKGAFLILVLF